MNNESLNAYSNFDQSIAIPSPAPRRQLPAPTQSIHDPRVRYFHAIMSKATTRTWRCLVLLLFQMALLSMDLLSDGPKQVSTLGITRCTLRISLDNTANPDPRYWEMFLATPWKAPQRSLNVVAISNVPP